MAAVSNNMHFIYSLDRKIVAERFLKKKLPFVPVPEGCFIFHI